MDLELDNDGYLKELSAWNPKVAVVLATAEELDLTDAHWDVLNVLRDFHRETGVSPSMRPLVKLVRESLGEDKGTSIYLLGLFPGNPAKVAAKIAGLPRPTNCI
jgi:tRNA 2-thiouridine synthesizing protein E